MSHEFKLKYNQLRENDPTQKEADKNYERESNARNVCFIKADGKMIFLNYGYLIHCEFCPQENEIVLSFTSHIITLKGMKLETLFHQFFNHFPKLLDCTESRYKDLNDTNQYQIFDIDIYEKNEN